MAGNSTAIFREVDLSGFGYEGVSHVGHGHSASAQLVREVETEEILVAKCVSLAALSQKDQTLAHQEVFLLQELHHPLIVSYHDSFVIEGTNILVILMEYCDGGDLRKLITQKADSGEHFTEVEVMTWFVQILKALEYIHSVKVLHRDLKTSNIFLSRGANGESIVKLGDFGISRVLEGTCDAAVTMVGTPYYMSPEVCRSEPYSWKSDVWALGCVLYELCMLKHAFESSSLMGLVYKIVSDHYDPIPPFYSQELNNLLTRLLNKKASERPSVEELIADPFVNAHLNAQATLVRSASGSMVPRSDRRVSKGLHREASGPGPAGALPPAAAAGCCALGPRTRLLVLAQRIRHRLVAGRLNWIATFANFDDRGDGALSRDMMRSALAMLHLGLSTQEISDLVDSLAEGPRVPLSCFESKLVEANTSIEALQLSIWARNMFRDTASPPAASMRARDVQHRNVLSVADFVDAVQELVPEITPEELDAIVLLADKNEFGDIDYLRFCDEFATDNVAPLARWPEHLGAPPPPPPLPEVPVEDDDE